MTNIIKFRTLDEVLAEPLVILDTCLGIKEGAGWFKDYLYDQRSYYKFETEKLQDILGYMDKCEAILRGENVFTSPKVSLETKKFMEILRKKLIDLNRINGLISSRKGREVPSGYNEKKQESRELLEEICFKYQRIQKLSVRKTQDFSDTEEFQKIHDLVLRVTDQKNVKKNQYEQNPAKEDIRTDEELVAMGLYLSGVQQQSINIITTDSHLPKITFFSTLELRRTNPPGSVFANNLKKYPLIVNSFIPENLLLSRYDSSRRKTYYGEYVSEEDAKKGQVTQIITPIR